MDTKVLFQITAVLLALIGSVLSEKGDKLSIGVKKRIKPEECTMKSKKGDTLKMHYTVSILLCSPKNSAEYIVVKFQNLYSLLT